MKNQLLKSFFSSKPSNAIFSLMLVFMVFISENSYAQPTVLGTQIANGSYVTYDLVTRGGGVRFVRINATSAGTAGARNWEFATGTAGAANYTTNWRPYTASQQLSGYNTYIDPASAASSARYNTSSGGASGTLPAVVSGSYYTFNVGGNSAANNFMTVLSTTYNPKNITSASQSPIAASVNPGIPVVVTTTISAALSTNETVYLRYSNDGFTTSTITAFSTSGTTLTATIPGAINTPGANISYYIFSSNTASAPSVAQADYFTLNLYNASGQNASGGGTNYTYTVGSTTPSYTWNQTGTASWATSTNWTPTRSTPGVYDNMIFNNGATTTVTNVPTQTIGGLLVSGSTNVTLDTTTGAQTLTISNGVSGNDLSVASGSQLNVAITGGAFPLTIAIATGALGSVSGSMSFSSGTSTTASAITSADANGLTFNNGAVLTQGTNNTGNIFGSGTANSVVFANGSTFNHFAGSNPFQKGQPASVVVFNSASNYINNQNNGNGFSFSGRTYGNITFSGTGTVGATGTAGLTMSDLSINSGTFNLGMTTVVASIKGNISVANGAALVINPASTNTNLNGSGVQSITTSGTGSISVASTSTLTVVSGSTVDFGTSIISGAGTFTAASGSTVRTGNTAGIASSGATGSIQTTTRTLNSGANYVYNGTGNQTTGTGLPSTVASLTVNNTGTSPTNVVTLTNGVTTASVVLTAGKLDLNAKTLTVSSGGTVSATAGDFTTTAGPVAFAGTATVSGTVNFPTATMAGGVNFGSASNIVTSLQMNSGAFVSTNAPTYGTGSTLIYNTTGTYGRNLEWSATSGKGFPYHVQVQNGTTVDLAANGFADRAIAGNLNLGLNGAASAGSLSMGATTNKLSIGGNLVIGGNTSGTSALTLSSAIGGDVYVSGNWDTKTNGSYASNSRAVFFEGTGTSTVTTIGAATFDYLFINKTSGGTVSLANDMTVNNNLTLNAQLVTNAYKVIIPTGNNVTANPNGWVRGNLQKNIPTGTNSRTFEVGDATVYAPVTTAYTGVTSAGNIIVTTTDNDHPQVATSTIDPAKSVNRYYTITNSGVAGGNYDATFGFDATDVDGGASTSNFIVSNYVNPTWTPLTVGTKTSTSTQATGVTLYGDFQLGELGSVTTTWTAGAGTTAWLTSGNWSNGVPDATTDVVISTASFYPVISSTESVKSLTIDSGTSLTITSGNNLTVDQAVDNDGALNIESNANLKQVANVANTGSGTTNVSRSTALLQRQDYVMWSSPVPGQQLQAFSPATLSTRFYEYNPSTDVYNAVSPTADFDQAKGYLIRLPNNHPATGTIWTGTFSGGNAYNGDVSVIGLSSGTYNAVGNPYPSAISADAFITANSITEALYFWRKTNNVNQATFPTTSYATYTFAGGTGTDPNPGDVLGITPNGHIAVGQGFIAKTTSTSLNFTNTMRETNNSNQFLRTSESKSRYWLDLKNDTGFGSQMMVAYMPNATTGIDAAIDGRFINDVQTALTSVIAGEEFTIQGRPLPFSATDVVPLGFKSAAAGTFNISINHTDGFFQTSATPIYLKDNLNNTIQDLTSSPYTFATEAGVYNTRFEILYENLLAVNQPAFNAQNVVVYKQNNAVVINTGATAMNKVQIYDISGRLLAEQDNINATETRINAGVSNQVLIVKVTSANNETITKKIVN